MDAVVLRCLCAIGALIVVVVGLTVPALTRAADRVYWSNSAADPATISYANLDGSGSGDVSTTAATLTSPEGVALDPAAGRVYWANWDAGRISWAALDGSADGDLTTTGATVRYPEGVAVDPAARKIYWSNSNTNTISWATLDGSGGGAVTTTRYVYGPVGLRSTPLRASSTGPTGPGTTSDGPRWTGRAAAY